MSTGSWYPQSSTTQKHGIDELLSIMAQLRDPQGGCPWDLKQDFGTILPYTLEEAYEVAEAIEKEDMEDLCGELGDLLFQVVFHARMAEEQGSFAFVENEREPRALVPLQIANSRN